QTSPQTGPRRTHSPRLPHGSPPGFHPSKAHDGLLGLRTEPAQNQSFGRVFRMRAGFPATTVSAGTSFVSTLPAPTTARSPTVIPQSTVTLDPIDAPAFTSVGTHCQSFSVCNPPAATVARGYRSLINVTLCPIKTSSSSVTPSHKNEWLDILQRLPTFTPFWISTKAPIFTSSPISHP